MCCISAVIDHSSWSDNCCHQYTTRWQQQAANDTRLSGRSVFLSGLLVSLRLCGHDDKMTQERLYRLTVASQNGKRVSPVVLLTQSTFVQWVWGLLFVTGVTRGHDGTVKRPVRAPHAAVSVSASASAARHIRSTQITTATAHLCSFLPPRTCPGRSLSMRWDAIHVFDGAACVDSSPEAEERRCLSWTGVLQSHHPFCGKLARMGEIGCQLCLSH